MPWATHAEFNILRNNFYVHKFCCLTKLAQRWLHVSWETIDKTDKQLIAGPSKNWVEKEGKNPTAIAKLFVLNANTINRSKIMRNLKSKF